MLKILHRALDFTCSHAWGYGPSTSMTFGNFLISWANIWFFKGNVLHNLSFQLTNWRRQRRKDKKNMMTTIELCMWNLYHQIANLIYIYISSKTNYPSVWIRTDFLLHVVTWNNMYTTKVHTVVNIQSMLCVPHFAMFAIQQSCVCLFCSYTTQKCQQCTIVG